MELFADDIFTADGRGTLFKHTGLGTFGHVVPADDLIECDGPVKLTML
jgi:hypothetical protein